MADYLYESARVRVLETRLLGKEGIETLLGAKDLADAVSRLADLGISPVTDAEGRFLREETLSRLLRDAYAELSDVMEKDLALALWRYPYDCNNVKAAIKGRIRGIDPRSMLFDFGTFDVDTVLKMVETEDFSALPEHMRAAAVDALDAYAKSKNPQTIDLILDSACYADMRAAAARSGVEAASRLVCLRIDLCNLLTVVRILRMERSGNTGRQLLEAALIEGGTLSIETLTEWFEGGEELLWERLYYTPLSGISVELSRGERTLTDVERSLDNYQTYVLREAKYAAFGAEVLIAYLVAVEYEVRNLRILLAGKSVGLDAATIRERIRDAYV